MRKLIDNLKTTETNMDKRSYDRSESVNIDGKPFHFTPDRKEFLSNLTSVFKNQTSFSKEDFDKVGGTPLQDIILKTMVSLIFQLF